MWDAGEYLTYGKERARPFADLIARVEASSPAEVVDLGCGPATTTATLARRWPDARIVGVDSSPEMIAAARRVVGVELVEADLREWSPDRPIDVLLSNATLQWVPGHLGLLPRLASWLAPGGTLAFQVPANFGEPAHVLLRELSDEPRWRDRLDVAWPTSHEPPDYLDALIALGLAADVWETTYFQVLAGEDAVLDWMRGTALRPVLALLGAPEQEEFVGTYAERLRRAYPKGPHGTVLPYRRVFAAAHRIDGEPT